MPNVVSFINYKGGVGKTTTTYHVGCSLAGHHKKRVLLIDIDPQTNLTFLCAPVEKWQDFKRKQGTIADVYGRFQEKKPINTTRCIWHDPVEVIGGRYRISGLDLLPCDIDLLGEDLGGVDRRCFSERRGSSEECKSVPSRAWLSEERHR